MGILASTQQRSHYVGEGCITMPVGPRPLSPNVAEVTMEFIQDGQYLYNKHHFLNNAGWDAGSLNNLGTAVREWWEANCQQFTNNNVTLQAITCRDLSEAQGLETAVTTDLPQQGAGQTQPMPNHVTIAVAKKTGFAGRSFSGRTYYVGLSTDMVTVNTLEAAFVNELRDAFTALIDPNGLILPGQLCVLSEVQAGNWRAEGICTPVTGISVDPTLDSQRRRLPGRGR